MQSMATVVSMHGDATRPCLAQIGCRSGSSRLPARSLLALGLEDFLAAVIAGGADVMAQVHLACSRLDREWRVGQKIMGAVHAALGGRFLVLLNCHVEAPSTHIAGRFTLFMTRYHRQRENHFVLDEPRDVHVPGRDHPVDLVVGVRDLARVLSELQLRVEHDGNLDGIEAALANQPQRPDYRKPQTRLAVTCLPPAQTVLQPFGRAPQLRKARQPLHAHTAPPLQRSTGKLEAVYHLRLRHRGRMILCPPNDVKRNFKLFRALLHFLILAAAVGPAFAQVYKWVDERGVTHYGERPPQ